MAEPLVIKICGIKTPDMLETAIAGGADMVGFMHFQRSPRHASVEQIADLISQARGRIDTCVVLVNPDNSCVAEVAALGPDWTSAFAARFDGVAPTGALREGWDLARDLRDSGTLTRGAASELAAREAALRYDGVSAPRRRTRPGAALRRLLQRS